MKKNVLILLLLTAPLSLFSQTVRMFYNPTYSIVDGKASATFDISLPEEGAYMVYCWIQGVKKSSGGYHSYTLKTVGSGTSSVVVQNSGDWGYSQGSYIFIPYYVTQLRIEGGSMVDVPNVECLAIVSEPMTLGNGYAAMKNHLQHPSSSSGAYASEFHYHDSISDGSYPPVGFMAKRDKALYYTFQRKEYYLAGQTVTVSVTSSLLSSGSCVVNLFADTEHPTYSWTGNSSLTAQITSSGFYNVMIRGNADGVWGTCDFNINGERYFEDVPVNTSLDVLDDDYLDHNRCCFALCSNGDAASMLLNPVGSVFVYSEDHGLQPSSDFDWGVNPLAIQRMLPGYAHFTTLSNSIPKSNFTAKADVYTGVTYGSSYLLLNPADYPNYKNGDRMISAPASLAYNELAWAFGEWCAPLNYWAVDLNSEEELQWMESNANYYGYTMTGASESNAVIDVYQNELGLSHAAVKSGGNFYAAGYDWESKLGSHERVFHPRHSLEGGQAGYIGCHLVHMQNDYTEVPLLLCERRDIANAELTEQELDVINQEISALSPELLNSYKALWDACQEEGCRQTFLSLRQFEKLSSYSSLLDFCKNNPSISSYIFLQVVQKELLAIKLLGDMADSQQANLLRKILRSPIRQEKQNSERPIIRPARTDAIIYIKSLINGGLVEKSISEVAYSSSRFFTLTQEGTTLTVSFELASTTPVTIGISEPLANTIYYPIQKKILDGGNHAISFNVPFKGLCEIAVFVGGSVYEKKVIIK